MRGTIMKALMLSVLFTSFGFAQSVELEVLAQVDDYSQGYNDIWGYTAPDGREYALLGIENGMSIVDITDAPALSEVTFISATSSGWRDIKTYRNYAYMVNESGGGMQIVDLSDLPNSATHVATYNGFTTSHNIFIDTASATLFAEGDGSSPVRLITLADPLIPVELSTFGIECHDIYARDGIAYISEGGSGSIGIYDFSVAETPTLVERLNIPSPGYVHNVWLSDDGTHMMSTEETPGKTVKYWDISDIGSITMTDEYLSEPSFFAHNVFIKGDYAYLSHYDDGMRVVDISDPDDIFETAFYNTSSSGLGAWGTYPFFDSGKIVASDVSTGLWVFFFEGALAGDLEDPNTPTSVSAYSDYTTPTSMLVTWDDPTELINGTPIAPGDFVIEIERDGLGIGSVPGGSEEYTDNGLTDGQEYSYSIYTRLLANDSTSRSVGTSWVAGGSPVPDPPTEVTAQGDENEITITWRNSSTNDDGTPIDDIAGVNLYQDGAYVATFDRTPDVAGELDTLTYMPASAGFYSWYMTTVDDEVPENESVPSEGAFTPLSAPFVDLFADAGDPNPDFWITEDADVNARSSLPPSAPYALNLNGNPDGGDLVDLRPFDLTGLESSGITVRYSYQPQGLPGNNDPETGDSLMVFFKNDLGSWFKVRSYAGRSTIPFVEVIIDVASESAGSGTFFHSQFQVRFQSYGTGDAVELYDDWFVDDFSLDFPTSVTGSDDGLPGEFALGQNFPNPFNPSTTLNFDVPQTASVRLSVFNILGEEVRTLINGVIEAGSHQIVWDGLNNQGVSTVSGVYFYRLEAADFVSTRKMILMK